MSDTTFLYFRPGGKWKYEGRGVFPPHEVTRETIRQANGGALPGLNPAATANEMIVVVMPDEACDKPFAYPRLLRELERSE